MQTSELRLDNPLGRVLSKLEQELSDDDEALYLTVEEALTGEQIKLEHALTFLKLVAANAPMLGLLGTVTCMIETFQAITLHGSGDPKLMSGGISQALVTTVAGLVIAFLYCRYTVCCSANVKISAIYWRLMSRRPLQSASLGLLGTVTGIVETFDLIHVFGSAEPRIVARGISQSLITTMAGLVLGLFGVAVGYDLNRRARSAERFFSERLRKRSISEICSKIARAVVKRGPL